jgi:hypothetical protein
LRAQTIEAQPVFGQIEPSRRPGASRAEAQPREMSWLVSVLPYKRLERSRVKKETQCGKLRHRCPRETPSTENIPQFIRSGTHCQPIELLWNGYRVLFAQVALRALIYANLFDAEGEEIIPCVRLKSRARSAADCPARFECAGLGEDGQTQPCRAT